MFNNVKISTWQMLSVLLVSRAFNTFNYVPMFSNISDMSTLLIGNILALIVQLILIIPAIVLFNRHKNNDILSLSSNWSKTFGKIISIIFLAFTLISIIGTVVGFEFYLANVIYPNASAVLIVFTICISCFLVAQTGLEGVARASTIVFIILIIGVIFVGVSSLDSIDLLNIKPLADTSVKSIYDATAQVISSNSEIWFLLLMVPVLNTSYKKVSIWFLIISAIFIEVVNFLVVGVLGEFAQTQVFPYFTLASLAETSIIQRLDSVHMIIWVCISFIKITVYAIIANLILKTLLPKKISKFSLLLLFIITVVAAIFISAHPEWLGNLTPTFPYIIIILTMLFPLILCLRRKEHSR